MIPGSSAVDVDELRMYTERPGSLHLVTEACAAIGCRPVLVTAVDLKIEEPTGLGAVVETRDGRRFVVDYVGPGAVSPRWYGPTPGGCWGRPEWAAIGAVKVLNPGVPVTSR